MLLSILQIPVHSDSDLLLLQQKTKQLLTLVGLSARDQTGFATAISEIVRGVFQTVEKGQAEFSIVQEHNQQYVQVCLRSPSVLDLELTSAKSRLTDPMPGQVISSTQRLVDQLTTSSDPETGTRIIVAKRLPARIPLVSQQQIEQWRRVLEEHLRRNGLVSIHERGEQLVQTVEKLQEQHEPAEERRPTARALPPTAHTDSRRDDKILKAVLDATGDAIVMYGADSSLQLANRWFHQLFGLGNADLKGYPAKRVRQQIMQCFQDPKRFEEIEASFFEDAEKVFEGIAELSQPERRMLYRFAAPVRDPQGKCIGRMVLYRDISKEVEIEQMKTEVLRLRADLEAKYSFEHIIGRSSSMMDMFRLMQQAIESNISVLIQGESGTGKELVAKAIHFGGPRKQGPFVAVNCAAIPETLIESELFGHERGAFTGAIGRKTGRFEQANGGTILLDEIAEMPPLLQVKLLRVLQERELQRVGGTAMIPVDVRVIASTNQDLSSAIQTGSFREDLFYRIAAFPIFVPPLRTRRDDIPLLVEHFLAEANQTSNKQVARVPDSTMRVLMSYRWPGNVRELENTIERAVLVETTNALEVGSLPTHLLHSFRNNDIASVAVDHVVHDVAEDTEIISLEELEKQAITHALKVTRDNVLQAAQALGINRATLYRKIKRYGLTTKDNGEA